MKKNKRSKHGCPAAQQPARKTLGLDVQSIAQTAPSSPIWSNHAGRPSSPTDPINAAEGRTPRLCSSRARVLRLMGFGLSGWVGCGVAIREDLEGLEDIIFLWVGANHVRRKASPHRWSPEWLATGSEVLFDGDHVRVGPIFSNSHGHRCRIGYKRSLLPLFFLYDKND